MPLYEYQCEACGHRFEVIQKFSDAPLTQCPTCAGPVAKLLSSPAIQFKGSGWYITDYARSGSSGGNVAPGKNDSGGSSASPATETGTSPAPAASAPAKSDTPST
jgi:putative FmdB family regulatory protein